MVSLFLASSLVNGMKRNNKQAAGMKRRVVHPSRRTVKKNHPPINWIQAAALAESALH
jgi:hypothetical protein